MRPKTLLLLSLVVLALAAFIWFYERDLPSSEERVERAKKVLSGLEVEDVEAVEIAWEDRKVHLVRQPPPDGDEGEKDRSPSQETEWRLTEPVAARASGSSVDGLVRSLIELEKQRTLEEFDPGEAGLDPPRVTVTLTTAQGPRVLRVGGDVPASSDMIVAVDGEPEAHVVSNFVYRELTKEPGAWRDRKLIPGSRSDVARLAVEAGGGKVVVAVRGHDEFWLEEPLADRADVETVDGVLSDLDLLRASGFVDHPEASLEEMGLAPPAAALEVTLAKNPTPFRLELGAQVPDRDETRYYGRADGQLFETTSTLGEKLAAPVDRWRSRSWTAYKTFQIDRFRVEDGAGSLELTRDDIDWRRDGGKIEFGVANELVSAVTRARGERLVEAGEAEAMGLGAPRLTVTLTPKEDEAAGEPEVLTLHPLADGTTAARSGSREVVLILSAETVEALDRAVAAAREAEVIPEGEAEEGEDAEAAEGEEG